MIGKVSPLLNVEFKLHKRSSRNRSYCLELQRKEYLCSIFMTKQILRASIPILVAFSKPYDQQSLNIGEEISHLCQSRMVR